MTSLCLCNCTAAEHGVGGDSAFSQLDAAQLLSAYTRALATGDTARIRPFWSERAVSREGFWFMHAWTGKRLDVAEWGEFLRDFDFAIADTRPGPSYHVIDLKWVRRDTSAAFPDTLPDMVYHVVTEDGRPVLANPIDVLTLDWPTFETECFRFHYPPSITIRDHLDELRKMDQECDEVARTLQIHLSQKIDFYRVRTPEEAGDLLLQPPAYGFSPWTYRDGRHWGLRVLVSASFLHPHELVHLLQAEARIEDVGPVLTEGLAVALGGATVSTPELALISSRHMIGEPDHISLEQLLTLSNAQFFRCNYVTYLLSGSLVRFLLDRFDLRRLREVASSTQSPEDLVRTIPAAYGHSLDDLESMWHNHLLGMPAHSPKHTVPAGAVRVFSMADPPRDDVGDGDYSYPARHQDGVFDLIRFEVFSDSVDAYFRLQYRAVAQPVDRGGEQFVPGAVIAIDRGGPSDRHVQENAHGVHFADGRGYDIKLNVGTAVSISDDFGRVFFTTPDIWRRMADERARTVTFALPVELVGEPSAAWRYFVGVGLTSDRVMNFLHGGPAPVYREHPVFISGGNYEYGNPAFIDILLPESMGQVDILSDYDGFAGRSAVVPMVGGLEPQ